jgi:hypothetical protein
MRPTPNRTAAPCASAAITAWPVPSYPAGTVRDRAAQWDRGTVSSGDPGTDPIGVHMPHRPHMRYRSPCVSLTRNHDYTKSGEALAHWSGASGGLTARSGAPCLIAVAWSATVANQQWYWRTLVPWRCRRCLEIADAAPPQPTVLRPDRRQHGSRRQLPRRRRTSVKHGLIWAGAASGAEFQRRSSMTTFGSCRGYAIERAE